jgi:TFIIF-interacting CTD phosphatase-like protein
VKDLQLLVGNRELKDIIIIDNKVESYSANMDNGIPIKSFMGEDDTDQFLLTLQDYLIKLKDKEDVREVIRKDFLKQNI